MAIGRSICLEIDRASWQVARMAIRSATHPCARRLAQNKAWRGVHITYLGLLNWSSPHLYGYLCHELALMTHDNWERFQMTRVGTNL